MFNRYIESTQQIVKGKGFLSEVLLSDTATGGTLTLYDGTNTSGKVIGKFRVGDNLSNTFTFRVYPRFDAGLYAVLSGTAPSANIGYRDEV